MTQYCTKITSKKSGDYSKEATPVPISNTVVKLFCADDTWRATAWESRTSPVLQKRSYFGSFFFNVKRDSVGSKATGGKKYEVLNVAGFTKKKLLR